MNFEDTERKLNKLKSDYLVTKVPRDLEENGLRELLSALEKRKVRFQGRQFWFSTVVLMVVIIFISALGWQKVEAALPGDSLYPVKRFSEEIVSKVSQDSQIKMQNRAQEVVDLTKRGAQDEKTLEKTASEYESEVKSVNQKINSEKREEFDKKLERHQEEFKEVIDKSTSSKKKLEEVVQVVDKVRKDNEGKGKEGETKEEH